MKRKTQAAARTRPAPLAVVQSVSQRLSAALDLEAALQCLVDEVAQALAVEHVLVFLVSPSGQVLRPAAAHGFSLGEHSPGPIHIRLNDPALAGTPEAEAFRQGRAVLSGDGIQGEAATSLGQLFVRHGVSSRLCVPLVSSGPPLGVMSLGCGGRRFSKAQAALIQALAAQGALALERINLYDEMLAKRAWCLSIIEGSADGILVVDETHRIVNVNASLERLTGYRKHELIGRECRDVLLARDGQDRSLCEIACPFFAPQAPAAAIEGTITTRQGKALWVETTMGGVHDERGRLLGVVHTVRDLTQRREVERLKDEFISLASHELRTPLNHIKGFASTLLQTDVEWEKASQRDFLLSISREADRLTKLVENLLEMSRIEAGGLRQMERRWYPLPELVEAVLERLQPLTRSHPVQVALAPDLPPVEVNRSGLELVLANLLENAVRYSPPGSPITLRAETQADARSVVVRVADRGVGLRPEHLEKVFEKFYRVEPNARGAPGVGLGLTLCRALVEAHGGRIWAESQAGVGTTFSFSLPLSAAEVGA